MTICRPCTDRAPAPVRNRAGAKSPPYLSATMKVWSVRWPRFGSQPGWRFTDRPFFRPVKRNGPAELIGAQIWRLSGKAIRDGGKHCPFVDRGGFRTQAEIQLLGLV